MNFKKWLRNTFIFTVWTFLFFLWLHWFLLVNWNFDIFLGWHWQYIVQQWWYGGWVIQGSYFWIFILTLFFALPVWFMGLCFFESINYTHIVEKLFWDYIYGKKTKAVQKKDTRIRVRKKKSYKEVRPKPLSPMATSSQMKVSPTEDAFLTSTQPAKTETGAHFSHRELPAFDEASFGLPESEGMPSLGGEAFSSVEPKEVLKEDFETIMTAAGAKVIPSVSVGEDAVDYVALGQKDAYFILTDDKAGDWLADEERFNDEDPLWFSESSHRVSPLTVLRRVEENALNALKNAGISLNGHVILVKTKGNIINAEDMLEVWKEMGVAVARSNEGMPEELPSFGNTFPASIEPMDTTVFDNVQNILKNEG